MQWRQHTSAWHCASSARLSLAARKGVMSTMSERQNHHYTAVRGEHATHWRLRYISQKETYCRRVRAMRISSLDILRQRQISKQLFLSSQKFATLCALCPLAFSAYMSTERIAHTMATSKWENKRTAHSCEFPIVCRHFL